MPTTNLNIGMPDPFAYWYAGTRRPESYMPEMGLAPLSVTSGDDLQAQWHHQKMRDSHYMANAKVKATQLANARAFSSPNGYYMLPPPVLGQRRFANQSQGALTTNSARQDVPGLAPWSEVPNPYISQFFNNHGKTMNSMKEEAGELHGGVLRTTVGQDWAKAKLNERIGQFNAIDEAKQIFASGDLSSIPTTAPPVGSTELSAEVAQLPQLELAQRLQSILDALQAPGQDYDAVSRFVVADSQKVLGLVIRLATNNSADDITNALEFIEGNSSQDGISQYLTNLIATIQMNGLDEEGNPVDTNIVQILSSLNALFERIELYLKQMLKVADSPSRDRMAASKTLIKSLGFTKLTKTQEQLSAQVGNANRETLTYPTINAQTGRPPQYSGAFIEGRSAESAPPHQFRDPYFPGSYSGVATANRLPYRKAIADQDRSDNWSQDDWIRGWEEQSQASRGSGQIYRFTREAPIREDTQHGYVGNGGQEFSIDYRGAFGEGSGRFINTVEAPSDEGQYNTGGRPIGWSGAEDLAEEGGDEEGGEAEETADIDADSTTPFLRSGRDAITGEYDIAPQLKVTETPFPVKRGTIKPLNAKIYTTNDVPSDRNTLIRFIAGLSTKHPGYSQAIYKDSLTKNIRRTTIRKLGAAGLL